MHARTFGVHGHPSDEELAILSLADEFRLAYCRLQQERYNHMVDARNLAVPALLPLLGDVHAIGYQIADIEKEIKKLHSDLGDRNARTKEQEETLKALREKRKIASEKIKPLFGEWVNTLRAYSRWWASRADWKNVKTLDKRRAMYERLSPPSLEELQAAWEAAENAPTKDKHGNPKPRKPDHVPAPFPQVNAESVAEYMRMDTELDLLERELFVAYQSRGLHSAIRAEIVAASQPKLKEDGEGMVYEYHRDPKPEPWEKLVIQFSGGAKVGDIFAGKVPGFAAEMVGKNLWEVSQQIGTEKIPSTITYRVRVHFPLSEDTVLKRWSLVIRKERQKLRGGTGFITVHKRTACPTIDASLDKPHGKTGVVQYKIGWTRKKAGLEVCRFTGDKINESLILPQWLVEKRMAAQVAQEECDLSANAALQERGELPKAKSKQGVDALAVYCKKHPEDTPAGNLLDELLLAEHHAVCQGRKAQKTIEKIYEMVVRRVCSIHSAIVHHDLNLRKMKRYKTRDLLKSDKIPLESRKYLQAAAPGKLIALLRGYGLPASTEVVSEENAEITDVFSSSILSIGRCSQSRELNNAE